MMSYFMMSSENDVSSFDILQRQHSTMVMQFEIVNVQQTSITDLNKRAILILCAGIE